MEPNDEIKLIEAAQRDSRYFEALYQIYHDRIYRFVWSKVRSLDLAADITSDIFLKAMLGIRGYTDRGLPFSAWLFRLATNEINLFFRRTGKDKYVSIHPELKGEWDNHWEKAEAKKLLADALEMLSEEELRLIEWRFFDGFAFKEMAEMEGNTEAAVKMKVYRILDFLKEQLNRLG